MLNWNEYVTSSHLIQFSLIKFLFLSVIYMRAKQATVILVGSRNDSPFKRKSLLISNVLHL